MLVLHVSMQYLLGNFLEYKIKTKTAAAKKPNVSTPSSPKNKSVAEKLLKQQEEAAKKNK